MDLNTFAADLIKHLARIANAAEGIEAKLGGKAATSTSTTEVKETATKPAATKPAATKPAATKSTKPKNDRDSVKKALITVKDTISKEAAQAIYQEFGYEAMSAIEEKDFDAIFAKATEALEAGESAGDDEDDI